MKKLKLLVPLAVGLLSFSRTNETPPDNFCGIRNVSFTVGEEITFAVYYAVAGILDNKCFFFDFGNHPNNCAN